MRLGFIDYPNAIPFLYPFFVNHVVLPFLSEMTLGFPTDLNRLLSEDKLDVALTSSLVYVTKKSYYLPGFCIASTNRVMSVNLYTKKEVGRLQRIGITSESASSVALLKILCQHFWGIKPTFEKLRENLDHEAFLLIGGKALQHQQIPGFETIDLAASWTEITGLPFVFALFIVHPKYCRRIYELNSLSNALNRALDWSHAHTKTIHAQASPDYFKCLQYQLGHPEQESLLLFSRLYQESYGT